MPLTGEAKREYQRLYMRGVRNKQVKDVADAISRMVKRPPGRPRAFTEPVLDAARAGLALAIRSHRLDLDRVLLELSNLVEATKRHTVAGEATKSPDNDARCRAIGMALELHERAGTIPVSASAGPGGLSITLVQVHYGEVAGPTSGGLDHAPEAIETQVVESTR